MRWLEKISQGKKEQIVILLLTGVLLLVIALPVEKPEQREASVPVQTESVRLPAGGRNEEAELEEKLRSMLAQVSGVGECEVMVTRKSDGRKIVEKDVEQQQERLEGTQDTAGNTSASSSESTVYQKDADGNESPYVTEHISPEISGVLVIAQGGENAETASAITEAVMALFGVEAHKIKVMKME